MAQQLPFDYLLPKTNWVAPSLSDIPQDWNAYSRVSVDTETSDKDLRKLGPGVRRDGFIVGISLSFETHKRCYLPIRHGGGGNLDPVAVLGYVRDQAKHFIGEVVGAGLQYDIDYLAEEEIHFPAIKCFRDVLIADVLIYELERQYTLDAVGKRRCGVGKNEEALRQAAFAYGATKESDVKKLIHALPANLVGPYAEQDASLPAQVLNVQEKIIADDGLGRVWDLESSVLPVLVRMRRRGVRVNEDRLAQVERKFRSEEQTALHELKRITGVEIPLGQTMNAKLCAKALEKVGIEPFYNSKGPSITKEFLAACNNPAADLIRRARRFSKLQTTYVNGVRAHLVNGRLHCTFNQLRGNDDEDSAIEGAIARLSAADPNLQNQPNPEKAPDIVGDWRAIYEPEIGTKWATRDYSQQEPRWLVNWSVLAGRKRIGEFAHNAALKYAQRYNEDPTVDFHKMTTSACLGFGIEQIPEAVAKVGKDYFDEYRQKKAKIVGLARIYGAGGPKIADQLGMSKLWKTIYPGTERERKIQVAGPEAQEVLDRFDSGVPFAKKMLDADARQAAQYGFIRTWSERRLHFEKDAGGNYQFTHAALNYRIQGSAADQTKVALVELDKAGHYIQLQLHDEIDGSEESEESALRGAEIMRDCLPMKVPSKVDTEVGRSWGEAKPIKAS